MEKLKEVHLRWLLAILAASILLYLGRALLVPLSFAVLISFILYPVCHWLEKKKIPRPLAITACLILLIGLGVLMAALLGSQFLKFQSQWPVLRDKLSLSMDQMSLSIAQNMGITPDVQKAWVDKILGNIIGFMGSSLLDTAVGSVLIILIPVYVALILYHRSKLVNILLQAFSEERRATVILVIHQTIHTYYNFIKGMLLVYLIVGILNSVGLLMLGIPQAFLFGFIASILTFIPYVGIMVGALLPISVAWLTYDSVWYPLGVVGVFTLVQYLEANIIFPLAVSQRMHINTLSTIVAMILGGIIWGGAGMILFIPFVSILKLIADQTGEMKAFADLLGSD